MSHLVVRIVLAASLFAIVANAQSQLSASQASERAAQLANSECQRRFERSPFEGSAAAARFVDGRWHWKASAGLGRGDVVADISFSPGGDNPLVTVHLMDSRVPIPNFTVPPKP